MYRLIILLIILSVASYLSALCTVKTMSNAEPDFDFDDLELCSSGTNKTDPFATVKEYLNSEVNYNESQVPLLEDTVVLYPNPTNGHITIRFAGNGGMNKVRIAVYDNIGRTVVQQECSTEQTHVSLNLGNIADGVYNYKILLNGSTHHGKFTKMK